MFHRSHSAMIETWNSMPENREASHPNQTWCRCVFDHGRRSWCRCVSHHGHRCAKSHGPNWLRHNPNSIGHIRWRRLCMWLHGSVISHYSSSLFVVPFWCLSRNAFLVYLLEDMCEKLCVPHSNPVRMWNTAVQVASISTSLPARQRISVPAKQRISASACQSTRVWASKPLSEPAYQRISIWSYYPCYLATLPVPQGITASKQVRTRIATIFNFVFYVLPSQLWFFEYIYICLTWIGTLP